MALNKQMEMFEDGGLKDEGGTVDPVSGNDVPSGSTQEEVRDDIPAQLSEGEFVFPADVVRFIGLGNLMRIRQEAKMGLKQMEAMGQMGNSDEATMPDDLPFDINDIDMEDDGEYNDTQEFAVGGMPNPNTGVYFNPAAGPTTGVAATPTQAASQTYVQQPQQAAVPTMQAYQASEVPTFQQTLGDDAFGTYDELRQYTNEAGNILNVPFRNGQPISPIPEGYTLVDPEATKTETTETKKVTAPTTQVSSGLPDDDGFVEDPEKTAAREARIAAAKSLGYTKFENPLSGLFKAVAPFGAFMGPGKLEAGTITSSGFVHDGKGGIFDPLTGEQASGSIVKGIMDSFADSQEGEYDPEKGGRELGRGSEAKQAGLKTIYDQKRDARIDKAADKRVKTEERRDKDKRTKEQQRQDAIAEQVEKAQIRADIKQAQAKTRAEMEAKEDATATAARISREQSEISSGQYQDSGGNDTTAQQAADDYTANAVAEAVSTGDYSRGFSKGGSVTKQMKQSGLASK